MTQNQRNEVDVSKIFFSISGRDPRPELIKDLLKLMFKNGVNMILLRKIMRRSTKNFFPLLETICFRFKAS
jgi:hypothetical protein